MAMSCSSTFIESTPTTSDAIGWARAKRMHSAGVATPPDTIRPPTCALPPPRLFMPMAATFRFASPGSTSRMLLR